ncbi:hypothetical protein [Aeromonas veronii]|uniref:hypothetical protein n=1 Tax=Aeromonas veronii TaxID=654 RepID=UPI00244456B9|nr:hypothetical protein [Aeromonas veronii]
MAVNHLLLPSLVVGAGSQYVDRRAQHSLSLDWEATSQLHGFASLNQSAGMGWGYDLQGIYWHGNSSLVASHSRNLRKQGGSKCGVQSVTAAVAGKVGLPRSLCFSSVWPWQWRRLGVALQ